MSAHLPSSPQSGAFQQDLRGQGQETELEINLVSLWLGMRRVLPLVVLVAVSLALAAYLWTRAQPVVYEASATVIASSAQSQIGVVGGTVVSPLPVATVEKVLQSPLVLRPLIAAIQDNAAIAPAERQEIVVNLEQELSAAPAASRQRTVSVSADPVTGENSVYTLHARASSARAAQVLADQASAVLLAWDAQRTSRDVALAQTNFTLQLAQVNRRLALPGLSALERQTLVYRRATMQDNLAQLAFLASAQPGSLKPLSGAVAPVDPVVPSALRNAILLGALILLLGLGLAALRTVMHPYVQTEDDLLGLGLPVLAVLPRRRAWRASHQRDGEAQVQEAIGFLQVRLLGALRGNAHPVVLVAGVTEREAGGGGEVSRLTTELATSLAQAGKRVLIVEVARRPERSALPPHALVGGSERLIWHPLGHVQVAQLREGVHLLPAVHTAPVSGAADRPDLDQTLRSWSQAYDLVLLDSPPLLDQARGLSLGQLSDGVLIEARAGRTSLRDLRSVLRSASAVGLPLVGFIFDQASLSSRQTRQRHSQLLPAPATEIRTGEVR
ncbi:tyrosine-protein kinase family protein [Deinococcus radiopugnans]|uniref:tyrosine-protein kinase family protein n=1 Tax=Deinococcus radiopugnans TaxID=57497 RepID=UPI00068D0C22|nr:tyrosine-protein kinase family protein [Deinococcus radiopugnans]